MTKTEAIAELENFKYLKGKSIVKKNNPPVQGIRTGSDTSKYPIKEVVVLPFGSKITDLKHASNPNNFTGHDWDVYILIEPHTNFVVKMTVQDMEKNYDLVKK